MKKNVREITLFTILLLFLFILTACGPPSVMPPRVSGILAEKTTAAPGELLEFSAGVVGDDSGELSFSWICDTGIFKTENGPVVIWEAPGSNAAAYIGLVVYNSATRSTSTFYQVINVEPYLTGGEFSWHRVYGSPVQEEMPPGAFKAIPGGGCILLGSSTAYGYGGIDMTAIKFSREGSIVWQKSIGGPSHDLPGAVETLADGSILIGGSTYSYGSGLFDWWLLKLDGHGNVLWQKTYGTTLDERLTVIKALPSGDLILGGHGLGSGAGGWDGILLKVDAEGNPLADGCFTFGDTGDDQIVAIDLLNDGTLIVGGNTRSYSADESAWWLFRLDAGLNLLWQSCLDDSGKFNLTTVKATSDNGFAAAGYREYEVGSSSNSDGRVRKFDASGSLLWEKKYTTGGTCRINSIGETSLGGIVVGGFTDGAGAGEEDFWLLKLNGNGTIRWQRTFGGGGGDEIYGLIETGEGNLLAAGITSSFGAGKQDFRIIETDTNGISGSPGAYTFIEAVSETAVEDLAISLNRTSLAMDTNPVSSAPMEISIGVTDLK